MHQKTGRKSTIDERLKNSCTNTAPVNNKSKHVCKYCNNTFTRKYSLTRHLDSRCKVKKEEDNIIQELLKEMEEMKEKITKLEKENKQTINNTINNNNINLVAYGEEDFTEVTDNTMKKIST